MYQCIQTKRCCMVMDNAQSRDSTMQQKNSDNIAFTAPQVKLQHKYRYHPACIQQNLSSQFV